MILLILTLISYYSIIVLDNHRELVQWTLRAMRSTAAAATVTIDSVSISPAAGFLRPLRVSPKKSTGIKILSSLDLRVNKSQYQRRRRDRQSDKIDVSGLQSCCVNELNISISLL